ncbi:MAG: ABC transporter permease [Acidimicrobiia bacterium]
MTISESAGDPTAGLIPAGAQPSTREYLHRLWGRRDYMAYTPLGELRARHMNTVFGNVWHLLNPMLAIGIYWLIFGQILKVDRGVENYIAFLTVGVFTFRFIQAVVSKGGVSLIKNQELMRSIPFPRAILPTSSLITESLAFVPALVVMYTVLLLTGELPQPSWVIPILIFPLEAAFALGAALIIARIATSFRDIEQILPFAFRLLFYASAVLFSADRFVEDGPALLLFYLNPIYAFITITRAAIVGGSVPGLVLATALISPVVFLIGGFAFFKQGEGSYARG